VWSQSAEKNKSQQKEKARRALSPVEVDELLSHRIPRFPVEEVTQGETAMTFTSELAKGLVIGGLAIAGSALALPRQSVERVYFENAKLIREVGYEVRPSCSGGSRLQGRRTRFVVRTTEACNGGGGGKSIHCILDGHTTVCPANICDSHLVNCN
jgi:hypothetical protein